jgi:hypothetical protein
MPAAEGIEECIANALWHECQDYLDCKTSNLERAASVIIERLEKCGYVIREDTPKEDKEE